MHPGVEEEAKIREMKGGLSPQRGFEQSEPKLDIHSLQSEDVQFEAPFLEPMLSEPSHTESSPHQAPHAPWMDLSAQISSLGTGMEELAVVSDTRFYSMEDHIDQY